MTNILAHLAHLAHLEQHFELENLNQYHYHRIMAVRCISRSSSQLTASTPSSAARAFLQITSRRYLSSTPPPVLDFLLPSVPASAIRYSWTSENIVTRSRVPAGRAFSSSTRRQQTTAIYNPKQDDDGNPMQIEITPRASNVRYPASTSHPRY